MQRKSFLKLFVLCAVTIAWLAPQESSAQVARFSLTIDGFEIASFSELSGITSEVEPVEFLQSSDKEVIFKKLPGKRKPPTITLKRASDGNLQLWAWHQAVREGNLATARRSCSLTGFDAEGEPVIKFFLEKAWPSKVEMSALAAGQENAPLVETVTLVSEFLQRVSP